MNLPFSANDPKSPLNKLKNLTSALESELKVETKISEKATSFMENLKQLAGDNSRLKDPRASEISLSYINSLGYFASECVKFALKIYRS